MNKTKFFYAVYVKTPEHPAGEPVAFCENKRLAKRVLNDYSVAPPKPGVGYHIRKHKMLVD